MPWGVVDSLLLWKEMAVASDGWTSCSLDFHGGLVMPSLSHDWMRWLWLRLLLVLLYVGAVVEETSLACMMDWAA